MKLWGHMAVCQLCRREKKLIKAHIIPKQLYRPIKNSMMEGSSRGRSLGVFYPGQDRKTKQVQNGIYDPHILCAECDNHIIGPWDRYSQNLFLNAHSLGHYDSSLGDRTKIYTIDDIDYGQLKLFCMSVLWRAAVSSDEFFSRVNKGAWEPQLRAMLLARNPGGKNEFSTAIVKYDGECRLIMSQAREVKDRPGFYFFRFPNYGFTIQADQKSLFTLSADFILQFNHSLRMNVQEYPGAYPLPRTLD